MAARLLPANLSDLLNHLGTTDFSDKDDALNALNAAAKKCLGAQPSAAAPHKPPRPSKEDDTIEDWSKTISFTPDTICSPTSYDDLMGFLEQNVGPYSVLGSLHSSSRIFEATTVISVLNLPKIWQYDSNNPRIVTLSTNHTLRETLLKLSQNNLTLPATGGTDEQTIAGLLGTNTAPATKYRSVYQGLQSVKLITLSSETAVEKVIQKTDSEFWACVANLGAIGVLVEATFATIPDEYMTTIQKVDNVDDVLNTAIPAGQYEYNSAMYPFWRIDWVPKQDKGLVWAARTIPIGSHDPDGDYPTDYATKVIKAAAFLTTDEPFLTPLLEAVYELATTIYPDVVVTGPLRNMLPVDRYTAEDMYCAMAEWAFHPSQAKTVKRYVEEYFTQSSKGWPNLPVEIEFVKADEYYMSPWSSYGLDPASDCFVKFNFMYLSDKNPTPAFRTTIENHIQGLWNYLKERGVTFKAHWGKMNFTQTTDTEEYFQWSNFKQYVQPRFLNPYLSARLPAIDSTPKSS